MTLTTLIDTGSQISVISTAVFRELSKGQILLTLPVKQTTVILANGKRAKLDTRQVWLKVHAGKEEIEHVFLVMPNLVHEMILGSDFLKRNQGKIDFEEDRVQIKGNWVSFHRGRRRGEPQICGMEMANEERFTEKAKSPLLDTHHKEQLVNLLKKHTAIFTNYPETIRGYVHRIRVKEDLPYQSRSYPIPFQYQEAVEREIKQMLSWGVIEKGASAYNNPMVVVKKKKGTLRLCLDARRLNSITIPERDTPTPIGELLTKFQGKGVFSTVDLTTSYWQIELHPHDRKYTSFKFKGHSYQFTRMPFGLINSGAGLIRCLEQALSEEMKRILISYVDDIVIASRDMDEHMEHLRKFFQECHEKNIRINLEKSTFASEEIEFLGHLVGTKGIRPHPEKVEAIHLFPSPRNRKQLRSFLGICNFYHRFYRNFASDAESLLSLLRKEHRWCWTGEQERDFRKIKENFLENIVLAHPDFERTFFIQTDSSGKGMGVILFQVNDLGKMGVLYFLSRLLKGPELNYTVTEKETLAIVWAFQKLKQFLLGSQVTVITDHKCLEFLNRSYLTNERLIRWSLFLQQFQYTIQYCPGKENVVADILSRHPVRPDIDHPQLEGVIITAMNKDGKGSIERELKELGKIQSQDPEYGPIFQRAITSPEGSTEDGKYQVNGGRLYTKIASTPEIWRLVVPTSLRMKLITHVHQIYGHYGIKKIEYALRCWFTWPGMHSQITKIINQCETCLKTKPANRSYVGKCKPILVEQPNYMIAIDFYGPLPSYRGYRYLLVVYDLFSKLVSAYALRHANTEGTIRVLEKMYFKRVGKPKFILSDHGTPFTSDEWEAWIHRQGVIHRLTAIRNPQSNPCERVMRELGRLFRTYLGRNHKLWYRETSTILKQINSSWNESTGFPPHRIHFGKREPMLIKMPIPRRQERVNPEEDKWIARENLRRKALLREDKIRSNPYPFQLGDLVLVKTPHVSIPLKAQFKKFMNLYEGPYHIIKVFGNNAFQISDGKGYKGIYNGRSLKPYPKGDEQERDVRSPRRNPPRECRKR